MRADYPQGFGRDSENSPALTHGHGTIHAAELQDTAVISDKVTWIMAKSLSHVRSLRRRQKRELLKFFYLFISSTSKRDRKRRESERARET